MRAITDSSVLICKEDTSSLQQFKFKTIMLTVEIFLQAVNELYENQQLSCKIYHKRQTTSNHSTTWNSTVYEDQQPSPPLMGQI